MKRIAAILTLIALLPLSATVFAHGKGPALEFDQFATPNLDGKMLFGGGNLNGKFTTHRRNGVEVALRTKQRFPKLNEFFSNGDGTYSVPKGNPCPDGFGPPPLCLATPIWQFEWSVNVDFDNSTGNQIGDYTYEIGMDADPGRGTKFTKFDPITATASVPLWDHAFGDNLSTNPGMTAGINPATYQTLLGTKNVAQNSWNYEFFNFPGTSLYSFDPNVDGNYIIYFRVIKNKGYGYGKKKRKIVAESFIQVLVGNAKAIKYVRLPRLKR